MKATTNKYSTSNRKLGPGVISFSREVGVTCPTDCPLLGKICYAEKMGKFRPNIAISYAGNVILDVDLAKSKLLEALRFNNTIRLHVSGDWYLDGELDIAYLDAWVSVFTDVYARYSELPKIFLYTHVHDKRLVDALAPFSDYIKLYASITEISDIPIVKGLGFTLIALATGDHIRTIKKKGKPPVKAEYGGETFLLCPNQRRHYDAIDVTCSTCQYCVNGIGNVQFMPH